MKFTIITLFPEVFDPILNSSILKRAQNKGLVEFELVNLRDFGQGSHKTVDDKPYGGGVGMVLKADVLAKAVKEATGNRQQATVKLERELPPTAHRPPPNVILTSASGNTFTQQKAQKFSKLEHIILVCGHYEGVDQRFIDSFVDEEISVGDYVLTGGEIPAMTIIDSVTRLIKGVLDKEEATKNESFSIFDEHSANTQLLEYPHYTRPDEFNGQFVPQVLLSGNHAEIEKWRQQQAIEKTKKTRPDLLK